MSAATSTRYPASAIAKARHLRGAGWSLADVGRFLEEDLGSRPSRSTVMRWTNPVREEKQREHGRRHAARRNAERASFRFPGNRSPEYRAAFMRRLRDEGMPHESIARCCRVVFDDPSVNWRTVKDILASDRLVSSERKAR